MMWKIPADLMGVNWPATGVLALCAAQGAQVIQKLKEVRASSEADADEFVVVDTWFQEPESPAEVIEQLKRERLSEMRHETLTQVAGLVDSRRV